MLNYYYRDNIADFQKKDTSEIIGTITLSNQFDSSLLQNKAWKEQIEILKTALSELEGVLFFEFSIPRMGKRVDVLLIIGGVVFVIEFKVGENKYHSYQYDQVWDYALDLKNFHKPSHRVVLAPILVATEANYSIIEIATTSHQDKVLFPIKTNKEDLGRVIAKTFSFYSSEPIIDAQDFERGSYEPTPTIIEAAVSLYNSHSVEEITRSDADAINLTKTTKAISEVIHRAKKERKKIICFVTGVPGAGKTLVGLKVATSHLDEEHGSQSVYLSGNAPLVAVLQEALARDKVRKEEEKGGKVKKTAAKQAVKSFIQIIHHYRDAYLINPNAPYDHVAIFDEAQRVWNREQTIKFMKQKKNQPDFKYSEPEFFVSCLNRHEDWAVIICLVGGGQEINTGEAGISEWLNAIKDDFPYWEVYISPNLTDSEYDAIAPIDELKKTSVVNFNSDLHLGVSMRSYRAEHLSLFVKNILDLNTDKARETLSLISGKYPIILTRDLTRAKDWLREKARGTERYGLIVSSQAQRLKPLAIDVRSAIDPVNWFLNGKEDVRSSYYLEDVATEFQVQGLELDWACITWDGDLRYSEDGWKTYGFKGSKWKNINHPERKKYLINAYRVLLTRARQGMVIVVPNGEDKDPTRNRDYYDSTFEYLQSLGIQLL